jgi:hypothetical protein
MRSILFAVLMAPSWGYTWAQPLRVLFIGNSYTQYNNLPTWVAQLSAETGQAMITAQSTPGGYTLEQHHVLPQTQALIAQGEWDFVVVQEQSQRPSFPDEQVAAQVLPYAQALVDSIRTYSPCAEVVFYMTWGRENGDAGNCPVWPPVCTYEGMQDRLRSSYLTMAQLNSAWCAPVGVVWREVRQNYPWLPLYTPDGSHPSWHGSYIAASTIASTILRRNVNEASFTGGLDSLTAALIRQLAGQVVLDSLDTWNVGVNDPMAEITQVVFGGAEVEFTAAPAGEGITYAWDLGDGTTATEGVFTHEFPGSGQYTVSLLVTDACGRQDSTSTTVTLISTGLGGGTADWYDEAGLLRSATPLMRDGALRLHSVDGRLLRQERVRNGRLDLHVALPAGTVVIWVWNGDDGHSASGKLLPGAR